LSAELSIGVAIPAYNNPDSLRSCLQSVVQFLPDAVIVVVDDSGNGQIAQALRSEFPAVVWKIHEQNAGFGRSATDGIFNCPADIVILLNDDVELLTDPSPALRAAFTDPALFAATFRSQTAAGLFREGAKRLVWPMGFPRILHNERDQRSDRNGSLPSAYAVGGHAAYRRAQFLDLGGFDPLFDPFYWEDVDLSVRAARHGWRTIYLPTCEVRHADHGAIRSSFDAARIREITLRNRLLFAWRHMPVLLRPLHVLAVGFELLASALSRERVFLHAYFAARKRWQAVL
jgi:GT2 family glycosyltransferase